MLFLACLFYLSLNSLMSSKKQKQKLEKVFLCFLQNDHNDLAFFKWL